MKSYLGDLALLLEGCHRRLAAAFALFGVSAAMDLACMAVLPAFVLVALSPGGPASRGAPWLESVIGALSLPGLSAAVVILFVVRAGFMLLVGSTMAGVAEGVRESVVRRLVAQILASPYEAALRRPAAAEITAATHYSITFSTNVVMPLLRLGLDALTIVAVLGFVAKLEPQAVLGAGAAFGIVGLAYLSGVRGTTARQSRLVADLQTDLTHQVTQALSSPREVRVYGLQRYFSTQIGANLRATSAAQAKLGAVYWFPRALGELTLIGLAIAYMILKAHGGTQAGLIISNLSVLAFAGLRLLPAFAQTMSNLSYIQGGRRITRVLADSLRLAPPSAAAPAYGPASRAEPFQSLELKGTSFRYAGAGSDALREVSFSLKRGQSAGVVGASGAGKSTLGDLLLGLLVPTAGDILLNGRPAHLDSEGWWRMAGFVPQSPYIANDTLLRNVAYGVPDAEIDLALVRHSLRLAQLEEVAARLPQGLGTLLGDQGVRLSGGQRQRVAIARALYRQRDFLVLDEATSALDQETEREVIDAIDALKGTITTFIIAHRLSTLRNCDFVIELRDGCLVGVRAPSFAA